MTSDQRQTTAKAGLSRAAFYRFCRDWHGYLSAVAFLTLLLFSATGLMLNHPSWFQGAPPASVEARLSLAAEETAAIRAAADPIAALTARLAQDVQLEGAFRSGEVVGDEVYADFQGVRGRSSVTANLQTGQVSVVTERETTFGILNGLHRGEHAGAIWRFFIDAMAIVLILVSIIGVALFFSLRFRLRTALILIGASLATMIGLFVFAVT